MVFSLRKLNLARRYLLSALVAALIPLALVAFLYDRYSASLLDNLLADRIESDLEAVAVKAGNFVAVQVNRLEYIVDLPDATEFFRRPQPQRMTDQLSEFLLLETENADVYAVEFQDLDGRVLQTIPARRARAPRDEDATLPFVEHGSAQIIGPSPPRDGRPGWFLIRKPVLLNQRKVGFVALRMRLSSLTEQIATLIEPEVYDPRVVVFERIHLTAVGSLAEPGDIIARSRPIIPGWRIHLVEEALALREPRTQIRYVLLVVAIVSALCLVWLFQHMSNRIARHLSPLSEGAREISSGNFNAQVPEDGPGELGALAKAFNRMRAQLGELIQSRVEMERRASMGEMAAGITHEVRNPLATIATMLHGLKHGERDPERNEMYEVIAEEIVRVDRTISEFLTYAKPSPPVKERVRLRDIFRSIQTLTNSAAHQRGVAISIIGDPTLEVSIDPNHLRQMMLNLTLNAIDALPEGGHIFLRAHKEAGMAEISVSDDGVGMSEELQENALRPFYTTRPAGTGLGLSVTHELVKRNGGEMAIESSAEIGTTITLRFPIEPALKELEP